MFDFYRKEQEEENERLRPFMTWVKYTLGLKHQVSKQRGEEYRAHGQNGWLWLSSTRRFTPQDANKMGLRAGNFYFIFLHFFPFFDIFVNLLHIVQIR